MRRGLLSVVRQRSTILGESSSVIEATSLWLPSVDAYGNRMRTFNTHPPLQGGIVRMMELQE
jgi:hypothetical protein